MTKEEIILAILSTILGSSVVNGIITHILYNNKLRKELKYKGNDMIAKQIEESLQFVRDVERELKTQEIYDISNILDERGSNVNFFGGECIYPAIFNDWNSFNEFTGKIHECRSIHEKNLSCKLALNLVFIDRYLSQLSVFMSERGGEDLLPTWGALFIFDLQKWQQRMDRMLVKEINRFSYKLESHETNKWHRLRKKELIGQYEGTILSYLLNGKCKKRDMKKMAYSKILADCITASIKQ